jgi:deoxycytidylate deaminase
MKHGCVITKGGRVKALGINKFRNHPAFVKDYLNCSTHAEMDALSRAGDCRGAVIYIARVNNHGQTRLSRPCNKCYTSIMKAGFKEVIYTD